MGWTVFAMADTGDGKVDLAVADTPGEAQRKMEEFIGAVMDGDETARARMPRGGRFVTVDIEERAALAK